MPFDGVSLRDAYAAASGSTGRVSSTSPATSSRAVATSAPETTVRDGRWKLGNEYETQTWHQYDLETDIGETTDLVDERPESSLGSAAS